MNEREVKIMDMAVIGSATSNRAQSNKSVVYDWLSSEGLGLTIEVDVKKIGGIFIDAHDDQAFETYLSRGEFAIRFFNDGRIVLNFKPDQGTFLLPEKK